MHAPKANYCTKLGLLRNGTARERVSVVVVPKLHLRLIPEVSGGGERGHFGEGRERSTRNVRGKMGLENRLLRKWQLIYGTIITVVDPGSMLSYG